MAQGKKTVWCFPELRTGNYIHNIELNSSSESLLKARIMRRLSYLCSEIGICLYKELCNSKFLLPNTTAIDFDLKEYYKNEYFKLGGNDQIAVVRLILDYENFLSLTELNKRLYVLNKVAYAYQKLAEMADVDTTELTKAVEHIQENKFENFSTYKVKISKSKLYEAGRMSIPYFGYVEQFIWIKNRNCLGTLFA